MENHPTSPIKLRRPPKMNQRQVSSTKPALKLIVPPELLITSRPPFSQVEAQLAPLFAHMKPDAELYLASAADPNYPVAVRTLEEALRYAEKWREDGMYASTGTFQGGTARKIKNLLSISEILLDADLKDLLIYE